MLNIFALRSRFPERLSLVVDPTGPENDVWISRVVREASLIVAVWGAHPAIGWRGDDVRQLLDGLQVHHLGLTLKGYPRHPLYVRANTEPIAW
jgi:hypothetical protein